MAEETEAEGQEGGEAEPKKAKAKSKLKLLIVVAAVILLVVAGVAAFLLKDKILGGSGPTDESDADPNAIVAIETGEFLRLQTFTVNLAPGSAKKILKITFELEMADAESVKIAEDRMPIIQDRIIMYLSAVRDVEVDNDMETIKSDLMRRLGTVVGDRALRGISVVEKLMQ